MLWCCCDAAAVASTDDIVFLGSGLSLTLSILNTAEVPLEVTSVDSCQFTG
jgi:hypothetical protein